MRAKKATTITGFLALASLGFACYALWPWLLETWQIHQLSSRDVPKRVAAASQLGKTGTERGANALLATLGEKDGPGDAVVPALGNMYARLDSATRIVVLESLLRSYASAEDEEDRRNPTPARGGAVTEGGLEPLQKRTIMQTLCSLELNQGSEMEALAAAIGRDDGAQVVAVCLLLLRWKLAEPEVAAQLSRLEPEKIVNFFRTVKALSDRADKPEWWEKKPGIWPGTTIQKVGNNLTTACEKPEAQAIALSFSIFGTSVEGEPYTRTEALRVLARKGSSPLVRSAAIRIAGFIGRVEGSPDLSVMLSEEKDPGLLREIIQARTLQEFPYTVQPPGSFAVAKYSHLGLRFQLWDGFVCDWLTSRPPPQPRSEAELGQLRELLARELDPGVRDAASFALAAHFRVTSSRPESRHLPQSLPALRVHEWGVFRDDGLALTPAETWLADLPGFVHRSRTSAADLWGQRYFRSSPSLKPVLFFYADNPAEILLRVGFSGGRPWSFYPEATDYLHGDFIEWSLEPASLRDISRTSPPWIASGRDPAEPLPDTSSDYALQRTVASGELRDRYEVVPWIVPNHSVRESGRYALRSMGLEWTGLRIGYGERLEGTPPAVDPASWWRHLRAVPSTSVALRGGHEKFLFYDGAVQLPSPLEARWTGLEKTAVALRVRELREYPLPGGGRPYPEAHPLMDELPGAFLVVCNDAGETRGAYLEKLSRRDPRRTVELSQLQLDEESLRAAFSAALEAQGLSAEETLALRLTWEKEFFDTPGLRLLTLLPRWIYDAVLPLSIEPLPGEIVRAGIVWREGADLELEASPAGPSRALEETSARYTWTSINMDLDAKPLPELAGQEVRIETGATAFSVEGAHEAAFAWHRGMSVLACSRTDDTLGPWLGLADFEQGVCRPLRRWADFRMQLEHCAIADDGSRQAVVWRKDNVSRFEVIDALSKTLWKLPSTTGNIECVALSGDGTKVAYRRDDAIVWVEIETGRCLELKSDADSSCHFLKLSRDGSLLYFVADVEAPIKETRLRIVDVAARSVSDLGPVAGVSYPAFSADGLRVVIARLDGWGNTVACLLDHRTGSLNRLAEHEASWRNPNLPSISADGKTVFYAYRGELWSIEADTGTSRRRLSQNRFRRCMNCRVDASGTHVLCLTNDRSIVSFLLE